MDIRLNLKAHSRLAVQAANPPWQTYVPRHTYILKLLFHLTLCCTVQQRGCKGKLSTWGEIKCHHARCVYSFNLQRKRSGASPGGGSRCRILQHKLATCASISISACVKLQYTSSYISSNPQSESEQSLVLDLCFRFLFLFFLSFFFLSFFFFLFFLRCWSEEEEEEVEEVELSDSEQEEEVVSWSSCCSCWILRTRRRGCGIKVKCRGEKYSRGILMPELASISNVTEQHASLSQYQLFQKVEWTVCLLVLHIYTDASNAVPSNH